MPSLLLVEKAYCFLAAAALFGISFNYRDEAQHICISTLLLVEKAFCILADAAFFDIFFNCRGKAQNIGIYLKRPL